jgi:hypothetical protein
MTSNPKPQGVPPNEPRPMPSPEPPRPSPIPGSQPPGPKPPPS